MALIGEDRGGVISRVGGAEIEANTLFRIERIKMTASLGLHPRAGFAIEPYHRVRDYAANSERDTSERRGSTRMGIGWFKPETIFNGMSRL